MERQGRVRGVHSPQWQIKGQVLITQKVSGEEGDFRVQCRKRFGLRRSSSAIRSGKLVKAPAYRAEVSSLVLKDLGNDEKN